MNDWDLHEDIFKLLLNLSTFYTDQFFNIHVEKSLRLPFQDFFREDLRWSSDDTEYIANLAYLSSWLQTPRCLEHIRIK